ncbi:unnamed protein product [Aureobasidium mustum]|uniref:Uncharacterized protein n=1 Tax=Aureobasidium mustum TaxID=2773714 RepID=A0A9N8JUA4_9PEZI|nr:unnamed protein product [Aureobasidium mustum]
MANEPRYELSAHKSPATTKLTKTNSGAWARPRPGAARTPQQSRSSNASPAPASSAAPAAKPTPSPAPTGNVWAARAAAQKAAPAKAVDAGKKKEQSAPVATAVTAVSSGAQETHVPVNNFNDGEVKQLLGRGEASSVYKVDASNASSADGKCVYGRLLDNIIDIHRSGLHGEWKELQGSFGRASHSRS